MDLPLLNLVYTGPDFTRKQFGGVNLCGAVRHRPTDVH